MKVWHFVFALFVCSHVFGQVGFGPEIGVGMSGMHFAPSTYPILYTSASVSTMASGRAGGVLDVPLNPHFYFQAGIDFSRKGASRSFSYYKNDSFNEVVNQTLDMYYAELPLNVLYKFGKQDKGRFYIGAGATPAYIIAGTNKLQDHAVFNGTADNTNDNLKIVAGKTISGFDVGANFFAGYELATGVFFRGYYLVGVKDIGLGTEVDKNRMWGISAGYIFGKGRNINKEADDLIDHSTN